MKIIKYILLSLFSFIAIFPLYWMLITAFSKDIFISDIKFIPFPPYLGAFKVVLLEHPFIRWILNSFLISISSTAGCIFFSSLAGFAFACLRFPYRDLIFYILLTSMILPSFLMVIPRFFLIYKLKGLNTYWGVFLPNWFSMFSVFLLRQYFYSIPHEVLNAARVDGANLWQIFTKIAIPAAKPIIYALSIVVFLGNWNSFLWPVIMLQEQTKQTLTVGLSAFQGQYQSEYNLIMAGAILALIPILIIFIMYQKYIEKGLKMRITF